MKRIPLAALLIGVLALIAAFWGWFADAPRFYAGWLAATTLLAAWPLGSLALLLVHPLTGGRWGEALAPALRGGVCTLPLLLLAAIPLAFGLRQIYPWMQPDAVIHLHNRIYLNPGFLAVRAAIYFTVWFSLGGLALRGRNLAAIAPMGLFLLAITSTFAAIDTTMSLDPHFVSSVYGMMTGAGMVLMALSVAVLLSAGAAPAELRRDFAKLLLALVVLWIYLDFMQLLIVWQSDLASESPWYVDHSRGAWGAVRLAIAIGHFVLPFFLLLAPAAQRSRAVIVFVAGLLVGMEILRAWWTVLPPLGGGFGWIDAAAMLGVAGVAIGTALAFMPTRIARGPHHV